MRPTLVVGLLLALILTVPLASASGPKASPKGATKRPASRDGWPETRAGALARRWVEAFSTGEDAMRKCYAEDLTPESLAKKGMDTRIEVYRKNRERFGKLMLGSVVESKENQLTVKLMATDVSVHEFIFDVQAKPPYKLVAVSMREYQSMHGFHGFHH